MGADMHAVGVHGLGFMIHQCWYHRRIKTLGGGAGTPRITPPHQRASIARQQTQAHIVDVIIPRLDVDVVGDVGRAFLGQAGAHLLRADRQGKVIQLKTRLAGADSAVLVGIAERSIGGAHAVLK